MRESSLQASIVRYLNRQPDTCARVNGPGPAHVRGDPDVYGCVRGLMFQWEIKAPGREHTLTAAQEHRLSEWEAAGADARLVTSLAQAKELHIELYGRASDHAL